MNIRTTRKIIQNVFNKFEHNMHQRCDAYIQVSNIICFN